MSVWVYLHLLIYISKHVSVLTRCEHESLQS